MIATVIKAPNKVPSTDKIKIFLAGSIEEGERADWQSKLIKILSEIDCVILNPRREDWDSSWKQTIDDPQFSEQVNWELDSMEKSDIIALYFDPKTKSPISLLELGLHSKDNKVTICCPDGFWRKGNVDIVAERNGIQVFDDFDVFSKAILTKVRWLKLKPR